ncbi:hypothetical protein CEXT_412011 [Caerostris extrusa]|uniref:Uncharacterized protein n=1 Tax=Caerostris extrusa TaxID=172846 RepID=A0AAV4UHU4_CAEEX|nr:hypothetical protein CEXT_412011 [Caerostris extrusa]
MNGFSGKKDCRNISKYLYLQRRNFFLEYSVYFYPDPNLRAHRFSLPFFVMRIFFFRMSKDGPWFEQFGRKAISGLTFALVIDTETILSPSKEKVSGFWRAKNYLIPDRHPIGSSNLSPESFPNHHLAIHGDTYPENTLSNTTLQTPSPERNLAISRARINTNLCSITSREPSYVSDVGK